LKEKSLDGLLGGCWLIEREEHRTLERIQVATRIQVARGRWLIEREEHRTLEGEIPGWVARGVLADREGRAPYT
jgi:hypothetical protein